MQEKATESRNKAIGHGTGAGSDMPWADKLERGRQPGPRMQQQTTLAADAQVSTQAVHAGSYLDPMTGAVGTPIFQTTTFHLSEDSYHSFSEGMTRDMPIYTRYGNPNQWAVQEKIAALEGAESALVMASGMAAISTTLLALSNRGGHVISAHDVYGGTYNFLREDMHQMGREVSFVDMTDPIALEAAIRDNTQILFFESLSNPLLKALPMQEIAAIAKKHGLLLIIDNTFLSPYHFKPLAWGADIVIHSVSKYMNGHSDLIGGCVAGSRKYTDRIWAQMLRLGGSLNPLSCFLLERGLKTLAVRMRTISENASRVAAFLADHPGIERVHYPTLADYPYPYVQYYCSKGFGGVVSFEVKGGDETSLQFLQNLSLPKVATSLGGLESLISLPFNTSHSSLTRRQREAIGIRPGLVRFSTGIEESEDLIKDFAMALDHIG